MEIDGTHPVKANISQFLKPESPPKYFGIDIDGTFYTKSATGLEKNIEAFAEATKKGFVPFFCTGRSIESSLAVIGSGFSERTGYKGYPGVYNNGSLVYDECGRIAHSEGFTREFLEKFGRFLIEKGLAPNVVFYTEHGACSLSPLYERLMKFSVMRKLPIPQVVTLEGLLQENILIIKYAEFDMKLSGLHEDVDYARTITLSNWLYTINPAGVNKSIGLKKLMEHYGLSSKDCGFIGDGDNDTEAMEFCDHSFCVDDTPDYVKRHAKWVLDKGHDEGAVSQALELIYGPFSQ
ncbi:haloacid dehalogenase-like hydrolase family member protein [Theileria equi strain WA]|uniref:Haloacid dehalogenase-like hydrolase family member protein n=1 Tax=Theileria equi strain WA TaxID=1537102 RepID=L1LBP7_THEEQ|nr:haloacid dehalogenase-like hydrolase family member protein [Theileria equi strain WA]EKX72603.1 haloacid dehalogenase-like hydrolase family member protein [Theileria equi strain WA]|eukprot:XP_004832055.1 haloacid dehalogenase-like hydrolase family member protein [Theileria equi strain WA]